MTPGAAALGRDALIEQARTRAAGQCECEGCPDKRCPGGRCLERQGVRSPVGGRKQAVGVLQPVADGDAIVMVCLHCDLGRRS